MAFTDIPLITSQRNIILIATIPNTKNIIHILTNITKNIIMDKAIKSVKKSLDKKMSGLVKKDVKRDKECEHAEKMAKKGKKK